MEDNSSSNTAVSKNSNTVVNRLAVVGTERVSPQGMEVNLVAMARNLNAVTMKVDMANRRRAMARVIVKNPPIKVATTIVVPGMTSLPAVMGNNNLPMADLRSLHTVAKRLRRALMAAQTNRRIPILALDLMKTKVVDTNHHMNKKKNLTHTVDPTRIHMVARGRSLMAGVRNHLISNRDMVVEKMRVKAVRGTMEVAMTRRSAPSD